jgi:hypothetical protein
MKSYILIIFISLGFTLVTCEKSTTNQEYIFEAKVLGRNTDCGYFAIQITNNIQQANEIAGTLYTENTFIAKNLPDDIQVEGLSIILDIRRIQKSESGFCTAMGPSYPWIYVIRVRENNL